MVKGIVAVGQSRDALDDRRFGSIDPIGDIVHEYLRTVCSPVITTYCRPVGPMVGEDRLKQVLDRRGREYRGTIGVMVDLPG